MRLRRLFSMEDHYEIKIYAHATRAYFLDAVRRSRRRSGCTGDASGPERTEGTPGFWWCGRYGLMRRAMPIEPVDIDPSAYEHITICLSIWVFSVNAPVRAFCEQAAGKIHEVDYILLHFTRGRYESAADTMDDLLKLRRTQYTDIRCARDALPRRRSRLKEGRRHDASTATCAPLYNPYFAAISHRYGIRQAKKRKFCEKALDFISPVCYIIFCDILKRVNLLCNLL